MAQRCNPIHGKEQRFEPLQSTLKKALTEAEAGRLSLQEKCAEQKTYSKKLNTKIESLTRNNDVLAEKTRELMMTQEKKLLELIDKDRKNHPIRNALSPDEFE